MTKQPTQQAQREAILTPKGYFSLHPDHVLPSKRWQIRTHDACWLAGRLRVRKPTAHDSRTLLVISWTEGGSHVINMDISTDGKLDGEKFKKALKEVLTVLSELETRIIDSGYAHAPFWCAKARANR